ncbi:hypothetical protein AHAS_Ahas16G0245900 [Arachis hypogaea]
MEIPLVLMFPNSTTLNLDGNWKSSPGDRRMNSPTATITGPQSALIFVYSASSVPLLQCITLSSTTNILNMLENGTLSILWTMWLKFLNKEHEFLGG